MAWAWVFHISLALITAILLVDNSTITPNFTLFSSLHTHSSELCNGSDECLLERRIVCSKQIYSVARPCICKQGLVWGEESHPLLKVSKVGIVKCLRRRWVHVDGNPRVNIWRAHLPQLPCIRRIQCWVNWATSAELVNSPGELAAVRESNSMCACNKITPMKT